MSKIKFDLRVRVRRGGDPRQAAVENAASTTEHWDESYVDFSGFFGDLGPELFAAAPDMLAALKLIAAPLEGTPIGDPWAFYADLQAVARVAIAKAEKVA